VQQRVSGFPKPQSGAGLRGAREDEAEGEGGVSMKTEIKKCECGIVWKLKRIKSPFGIKDTDSIACSCGRKVITWSGGYLWVGEVMPDKENSK